jgi:pimeloyl-ACP methyl ester carboxylesterase
MKLALASLLTLSLGFSADPGYKFAKLDGSRVRYQSHGNGAKAIVLIHGWTCDASFWDRSVPALSAKYRVIAVDLPGHGGSDKPEIAYTQQLFARAVDAVMQKAGVDRAVLMGHSMGAPVARQFLADYPSKVAGLVLVDGAVSRAGTPEELEKRKAQRAPFIASLRSPEFPQVAGKMIDSMFVPDTAPALRTEIKAKMLATPQHVAVSAFEGLTDPSMWTAANGTPTLAIFADKGRTEANDELLHELFRDVDHQEWAGAGHFLMMEKPEKFNGAVLAFLQKIGF